MARYTVVLRAPSGAYWPPDKHFTVPSFPSACGEVSIVLQTRRSPTPNFTKPSPRGIHVEVAGNANTLEEAMSAFSTAAELVSPVVSVAANAPIGLLEVELGFDSTPGVSTRAFFQQFLLDDRVMPIDLHEVPNPALKAILERLPAHPDTDRLHRAMSYYHTGISLWRPGSELAVLSYLYMAVETLTPVVLRTMVARTGSKAALLAEWEIEVKQLDSEVRRRCIFRDDDEAYKKAKWASDGLEHGFAPFTDLRDSASEALLATAAYVRQTILEQLDLLPEQAALLIAPPLDHPFFLYYTKYLRGTLVSAGEDLAAEDQIYPILSWKSTRHEVPSEPGSDPGVAYREEIRLRAAEGVELVDAKVYVFGPGGKAMVPPDQPKVETRSDDGA